MDAQPGTVAHADLVLRRSWDKRGMAIVRRNWPWALGPALAAIAWSVSASMRGQAVESVIWIAATVAAIALYVAAQEQHRLFVSGDRFGETRLGLVRRSFPIADIGRIQRITRRLGSQPPWPHIVVLDRNDKVLMDILAYVWADRDLDAFFNRLGLRPQGSFDQVVGGRRFRQLFPRR